LATAIQNAYDRAVATCRANGGGLDCGPAAYGAEGDCSVLPYDPSPRLNRPRGVYQGRAGEAVEIRYELAGLGSRFLALTLDMLAQVAITVALLVGFGLAAPVIARVGFGRNLTGWLIAIGIALIFLIFFGWFIIFEIWWSGRTPGKRALGLRREIVALVANFVDKEVRPVVQELEHANTYPEALIDYQRARLLFQETKDPGGEGDALIYLGRVCQSMRRYGERGRGWEDSLSITRELGDRAIEAITTGLQWRLAHEPVSVIGEPSREDLDACWELGAAIAAGLVHGTYGRRIGMSTATRQALDNLWEYVGFVANAITAVHGDIGQERGPSLRQSRPPGRAGCREQRSIFHAPKRREEVVEQKDPIVATAAQPMGKLDARGHWSWREPRPVQLRDLWSSTCLPLSTRLSRP